MQQDGLAHRAVQLDDLAFAGVGAGVGFGDRHAARRQGGGDFLAGQGDGAAGPVGARRFGPAGGQFAELDIGRRQHDGLAGAAPGDGRAVRQARTGGVAGTKRRAQKK